MSTRTGTRNNARDLILNRAVDLASIYGLIGQLAEDLSMSKGGICAHFPTKVELQLATVKRAASRFRHAVIEPSLDESPGLPQLRALSEAWLRYVEDEVFPGGCFFTNAMLELDDLESNEVRDAVTWQYNWYVDLIERCTREAIARGHLRPDVDARRFALQLDGIFAATLIWRGLRRTENPIELVRQSVADLFQRVVV